MRLLSNWSDLPAKRRHLYVYAGLLIFALIGNTIKTSYPARSPHAKDNSVKQDVAKFLGLDELPRLDAAAQSLLDSSSAK